MVKPDGVQRGLVGRLIARFEDKGFKLVAMKYTWASECLLRNHYAELADKAFFANLIEYVGSGPVVPMVWEGPGVVKMGRRLIGATNPSESAPGTIRGDFGLQSGRNLIHGSDSIVSAEREIDLWFDADEIVGWKSSLENWFYED
ncbi:nucleoside diphosphate kinase-like [Cylas formicarius]|uniref:nucleoside diphosphate kinase-like n=1 Tax=Cylas formicarius TaxID=197179 RepID=UPI0029586AD7|nr:nucleoside diphosphate kinase-like [Cylas formicarius]